MKNFSVMTSLLTLVAVLGNQQKVVADVTLLTDQRIIQTQGSVFLAPDFHENWNDSQIPVIPFSPFVATVNHTASSISATGSAHQDSTATSTHFGGIASASISGSINEPGMSSGSATLVGLSLSAFDVGFSLNCEHSYTLNALFNGETTTLPPATFGGEITLEKIGVGNVFHFAPSTDAFTASQSGLLTSGSYRFLASAGVAIGLVNPENAEASSSLNFSLDLLGPSNCVPDGGSTLMLLSCTVAGLQAFRVVKPRCRGKQDGSIA